jgi:hypothetical protein
MKAIFPCADFNRVPKDIRRPPFIFSRAHHAICFTPRAVIWLLKGVCGSLSRGTGDTPVLDLDPDQNEFRENAITCSSARLSSRAAQTARDLATAQSLPRYIPRDHRVTLALA